MLPFTSFCLLPSCCPAALNINLIYAPIIILPLNIELIVVVITNINLHLVNECISLPLFNNNDDGDDADDDGDQIEEGFA